MIYQLEKEREKYVSEAADSSMKYQQAMEEVKLREMTVLELQKSIPIINSFFWYCKYNNVNANTINKKTWRRKEIIEGETKLKQQQNLYEAVRSDRNLYSKNLIEAQDEIAEMKRKFKIMNHQIEQLKEEINAKDRGLFYFLRFGKSDILTHT